MRAMTGGALIVHAAMLVLTGCGDGVTSDASPNTVTVATPTALPETAPAALSAQTSEADGRVIEGWIGKWVGVEGLALTVAKGDAPTTYRLHVALMDGANDYTGKADGDTIRFERDGKMETIRHGTGEQTGLKWLADKRDCLIIRQAEGFCRD